MCSNPIDYNFSTSITTSFKSFYSSIAVNRANTYTLKKMNSFTSLHVKVYKTNFQNNNLKSLGA